MRVCMCVYVPTYAPRSTEKKTNNVKWLNTMVIREIHTHTKKLSNCVAGKQPFKQCSEHTQIHDPSHISWSVMNNAFVATHAWDWTPHALCSAPFFAGTGHGKGEPHTESRSREPGLEETGSAHTGCFMSEQVLPSPPLCDLHA